MIAVIIMGTNGKAANHHCRTQKSGTKDGVGRIRADRRQCETEVVVKEVWCEEGLR